MNVWNRVFKRFALSLQSGDRLSGQRRLPRSAESTGLSSQALENRWLLSAWVATDKGDYAPGQTAVVQGGGFTPGETIALQVLHADGAHSADASHQPWFVQDGGPGDLDGTANGQFQTSWYVGTGERNASLVLTASGETSQEMASTTFTDAPQLGSVTLGAQTGTLTYGTAGSVTYLVTVNRGSGGGSTGAFVADLSMTTSLPSGASFSFGSNSLSFGESDNSLTTTLTVNSSTGTPAAGGPFAFTISAKVSGNPADLVTTDGQLAVSRKALTGSITATNRAYDGTTAASISRSLSGVVAGDDVSYAGGTATFDTKSVGNGKTVTGTGLGLTGAQTGNYTVNSTATTTANISPLIITASITAANKTYDGTTVASISRSLTGAIAGDAVLSTGGTATFDTKLVGDGKTVTATGLSLTGADAGNYLVNSVATTTANIIRQPLTGSITVSNKTFDGTTAATITGRNLAGLASGDNVTYVGGTATFDNANVGAGKTVTATGLSITGPDAANYTVNATATTTANITSSLSIGTLIVNDLPTSKSELVAVPISINPAASVTVTAQSSNASVTASVVTGGRSVRLNVSGVDSTNTPFTGDIVLRLFETEAPVTTARIINLINSNFYNGLTFHRIIQDFMVQGGDPQGTGSGGTGTKFADEFNTGLTFTSSGLLAMANSGDDTNDSQFFVTDVDLPLAQLPQHLNFQHTIFGIMTGGVDIYRKLISTPVNGSNKPLTNAIINTATVFTDNQNAVVRLTPAAGFTGSTTLTVTANDNLGTSVNKQATVNVVSDTVNERAFLGTVNNQTTKQGTAVSFVVTGTDLEKDTLEFVVKDAASFATDGSTGTAHPNVDVTVQITQASGNNPASATITLTPKGTFTGTANLIVGVRDQTVRGTALNSRDNFDTQQFTLTVNPVNKAPTTTGGSTTTQPGQAVSIQLNGDDGDTDKTQTLTFEIVAQPARGTIANFNAATGALQYTPAANFSGTDTFKYRVKDNGGTDNGGADTSAVTTFTINVTAPAPTNLALATASDDGVLNDDRVISNFSPTFTVTAQAGTTVRLLINGTANVNTVETSPGQFTGTATRAMLRIGANTVTATSTANGVASAATAPLTFTYAPSYDRVYTVPGSFDSSQQITVSFTSRNGVYRNEFGYFKVNDLDGRVNGLTPGDAGYAAAALSSADREVIFTGSAGAGATKTLNLHGGELLVFYLVSNNSTANLVQYNPQNAMTGLNAFFSVEGANPDQVDHMLSTTDPQTGQVLMHWEDMLGGGDRDFNDAVFTVTSGGSANNPIGEALRVPGGPAHTVPVSFTLDTARKSAGSTDSAPAGTAQGEFGVYIVSDSTGTVGGVAPGSAGYLQAALGSSTRQVIFNPGDPLSTNKSLQIPGGSLIGWYYTPGSTATQVLASNSTNDPSKSPFALFSFDSGNPDKIEHFRWFGPERGGVSIPASQGESGLRLHILDQLFGSPNDFDDMMVSIGLP
ncbi:MAG: YDG domain-containing protein [Planctomycetales bacterium]